MSDQLPPVLRCEHLSKCFGQLRTSITVFTDISFEVQAGEMFAITGASGSGKSTLLHLLGGLDAPTAGKVFLLGRNLSQINETGKAKLRNQYLGFVYQFHHLLPEFSALENVCMPLLIAGEKSKLAKEKAMYFIDRVGLSKRLDHRIGQLSGGERQRIAIARALVNNPCCVLADEPTGNLDQKTAGLILDLMMSLNDELNTSFVVVTHNERLAQQMNKVFSLEDGLLQPAHV